jgi:hypothetical protein
VRTNTEQQRHDHGTDWCLHATRKRHRRYGCSGEVKRDGNEVGDRYHVIALI